MKQLIVLFAVIFFWSNCPLFAADAAKSRQQIEEEDPQDPEENIPSEENQEMEEEEQQEEEESQGPSTEEQLEQIDIPSGDK